MLNVAMCVCRTGPDGSTSIDDAFHGDVGSKLADWNEFDDILVRYHAYLEIKSIENLPRKTTMLPTLINTLTSNRSQLKSMMKPSSRSKQDKQYNGKLNRLIDHHSQLINEMKSSKKSSSLGNLG